MTTITFIRTDSPLFSDVVLFQTPLGDKTFSPDGARAIARTSGAELELQEALQNPGIPVEVPNKTRARGVRARNYGAMGVCQ
jgi:hypothetical protein